MENIGGRGMKRSATGLFGILILLLASLWMTGCEDLKDVKESTVTVDKKGAVTEALVEDFSAENYDAGELEDSVKELVKSYNAQVGKERVTIQQMEVREGTAKVFLHFETDEDYRGFNQVDFFSGTVKEAMGAGYPFSGAFLDQGGKKTAEGQVPSQCQDAQVIILQEPLQVLVPGNILYVSENMEILGKDQAKLSNDTRIPYENAQAITETYGYVIYSAK